MSNLEKNIYQVLVEGTNHSPQTINESIGGTAKGKKNRDTWADLIEDGSKLYIRMRNVETRNPGREVDLRQFKNLQALVNTLDKATSKEELLKAYQTKSNLSDVLNKNPRASKAIDDFMSEYAKLEVELSRRLADILNGEI